MKKNSRLLTDDERALLIESPKSYLSLTDNERFFLTHFFNLTENFSIPEKEDEDIEAYLAENFEIFIKLCRLILQYRLTVKSITQNINKKDQS